MDRTFMHLISLNHSPSLTERAQKLQSLTNVATVKHMSPKYELSLSKLSKHKAFQLSYSLLVVTS